MSGNKKAKQAAKKGQANKPKKREQQRQPMSQPAAIIQRGGPRMPRTEMRNGGTVVSHTETYGVNVTGTDPYTVFATWALQPGLKVYSRGSPLGMWLAEIAQNFDNYEIESLKFKFRTACSTQTSGLAVFGFEPNPEGTTPTTYQEMRNMLSVDGSVHSNLSFDVTNRVRRKLLIRKGPVVNLPSYDAGKVYFATIGVGNNALIGFIDVEYRVRLYNPQAVGTDIVPVANPLQPLPTQRLVWDAAGMASIDCSENSFTPFESFITYAVSAGATLVGGQNRSVAAFDQSFDSGCHYKFGAGTARTMRILNAGRYRLTFSPRWDWADLKVFTLAPFTSSQASNQLAPAVSQVYTTLGGTVGTIPIDHKTHRGFTGTAVGDPNPGTDVWPTFVWDVVVDAEDDIHILVGNLVYNVTAAGTNIVGRSNLGVTTLLVEYLGPKLS